jgi:hypothetical protein
MVKKAVPTCTNIFPSTYFWSGYPFHSKHTLNSTANLIKTTHKTRNINITDMYSGPHQNCYTENPAFENDLQGFFLSRPDLENDYFQPPQKLHQVLFAIFLLIGTSRKAS